MVKKIVIFGYGARGHVYSNFVKERTDLFDLVAIIENNPDKYIEAKENFNNVPIFSNYKDFLNEHIFADIIAICTQDLDHIEHAIEMMKNGYDLLLEKPIATNYEDCLSIFEASKKYKRKVIVCHVLRYAPFYMSVKNVLDTGVLGKIETIYASENVGYWHYVHSYVRGPWHNSDKSCCMILAKCCHDLDMMCYLLDKKCKEVISVGNLNYFNKENAPVNSADFCSDCPNKDCIFRAQTLYSRPDLQWTTAYFSTGGTIQEKLKLLEKSPYDRCVFRNDNNVVDNQVTIMNFEDNTKVVLTMDAFSGEVYRDLKIHGTKGELVGNMERNELKLYEFGKPYRDIKIDANMVAKGKKGHGGHGHGGGDYYLMENVYKALNGEPTEGITYLDVSIESHKIAFAAEESRLKGGQIIKIN